MGRWEGVKGGVGEVVVGAARVGEGGGDGGFAVWEAKFAVEMTGNCEVTRGRREQEAIRSLHLSGRVQLERSAS